MARRIAVDLDGTLVGLVNGQLALRSAIVRAVRHFRGDGNTIILWTFGNRAWWMQVTQKFPALRELFDEVYTRDDVPRHPEAIKDVRAINADILIDNEPAHLAWAKREGLADRYLLVPTFGEDPH